MFPAPASWQARWQFHWGRCRRSEPESGTKKGGLVCNCHPRSCRMRGRAARVITPAVLGREDAGKPLPHSGFPAKPEPQRRTLHPLRGQTFKADLRNSSTKRCARLRSTANFFRGSLDSTALQNTRQRQPEMCYIAGTTPSEIVCEPCVVDALRVCGSIDAFEPCGGSTHGEHHHPQSR